jgi:phage gp16-like protein
MEVAMGEVADAGREFIAHYGVKGMRWGVRNSSPSAVTTKSVVNAGLRSKTKVKAKGGQAHPAHEDAVKAAMQKQVLRKSGTAALSNAELRELGTRLELEQRVKTLAAPTGKKFVTGQLKTQGQQTIQRETSRAVDKAIRSRR